MHRQRGLTLLEALVALTLMALIGLASYQVLAAAIGARETQARHRDALSSWQRALWILQRDIEQWQRRDVRPRDGGERLPALRLSGAGGESGGEGSELELTSGGRRNPLQLPQSPLQRVRYRVDLHPQREEEDSAYHQDQQRYLLRELWFQIDAREQRPDLVQALLPMEEALRIEILTERGSFRQWPPALRAGATAPEPEALRMELQHPALGAVSRWWALP